MLSLLPYGVATPFSPFAVCACTGLSPPSCASFLIFWTQPIIDFLAQECTGLAAILHNGLQFIERFKRAG